jgi:ABC-2 type transport system permease protein
LERLTGRLARRSAGRLLFYGRVICQVTFRAGRPNRSIMNAVTYGGVETAQYPLAIYQQDFRRFVTYVAPLAASPTFPWPVSSASTIGSEQTSCFRRSLLRSDS